jgi:hypothetical protein
MFSGIIIRAIAQNDSTEPDYQYLNALKTNTNNVTQQYRNMKAVAPAIPSVNVVDQRNNADGNQSGQDANAQTIQQKTSNANGKPGSQHNELPPSTLQTVIEVFGCIALTVTCLYFLSATGSNAIKEPTDKPVSNTFAQTTPTGSASTLSVVKYITNVQLSTDQTLSKNIKKICERISITSQTSQSIDDITLDKLYDNVEKEWLNSCKNEKIQITSANMKHNNPVLQAWLESTIQTKNSVTDKQTFRAMIRQCTWHYISMYCKNLLSTSNAFVISENFKRDMLAVYNDFIHWNQKNYEEKNLNNANYYSSIADCEQVIKYLDNQLQHALTTVTQVLENHLNRKPGFVEVYTFSKPEINKQINEMYSEMLTTTNKLKLYIPMTTSYLYLPQDNEDNCKQNTLEQIRTSLEKMFNQVKSLMDTASACEPSINIVTLILQDLIIQLKCTIDTVQKVHKYYESTLFAFRSNVKHYIVKYIKEQINNKLLEIQGKNKVN